MTGQYKGPPRHGSARLMATAALPCGERTLGDRPQERKKGRWRLRTIRADALVEAPLVCTLEPVFHLCIWSAGRRLMTHALPIDRREPIHTLRAVATIGTGLINERFLAGQRRGESILGATFTVDEINLLKVAFDAAMTEAKAKGFEYPLDTMLHDREAESDGARCLERRQQTRSLNDQPRSPACVERRQVLGAARWCSRPDGRLPSGPMPWSMMRSHRRPPPLALAGRASTWVA